MSRSSPVIFGIDPGTAITGWAVVVESQGDPHERHPAEMPGHERKSGKGRGGPSGDPLAEIPREDSTGPGPNPLRHRIVPGNQAEGPGKGKLESWTEEGPRIKDHKNQERRGQSRHGNNAAGPAPAQGKNGEKSRGPEG